MRFTFARQLQRLDISSLPIVDQSGRLTGILRFDDAMDVLEEEASEDMYKKAGLGTIHAKDTIRSELLTAGPLHYPVVFLRADRGCVGLFVALHHAQDWR